MSQQFLQLKNLDGFYFRPFSSAIFISTILLIPFFIKSFKFFVFVDPNAQLLTCVAVHSFHLVIATHILSFPNPSFSPLLEVHQLGCSFRSLLASDEAASPSLDFLSWASSIILLFIFVKQGTGQGHSAGHIETIQ